MRKLDPREYDDTDFPSVHRFSLTGASANPDNLPESSNINEFRWNKLLPFQLMVKFWRGGTYIYDIRKVAGKDEQTGKWLPQVKLKDFWKILCDPRESATPSHHKLSSGKVFDRYIKGQEHVPYKKL